MFDWDDTMEIVKDAWQIVSDLTEQKQHDLLVLLLADLLKNDPERAMNAIVMTREGTSG